MSVSLAKLTITESIEIGRDDTRDCENLADDFYQLFQAQHWSMPYPPGPFVSGVPRGITIGARADDPVGVQLRDLISGILNTKVDMKTLPPVEKWRPLEQQKEQTYITLMIGTMPQ